MDTKSRKTLLVWKLPICDMVCLFFRYIFSTMVEFFLKHIFLYLVKLKPI